MSSQSTLLLRGIGKWLASAARKTVTVITGNLAILISLVGILISLAALLVSAANSYYSFFWHHPDFRVYLRFPDPKQIGTNTLDVNYFFVNMGNKAVMIEDVSIDELWIKSDKPGLMGVGMELDRCVDGDLFLPTFSSLMRYLPSAIWQEHKPIARSTIGPDARPRTGPIEGVLFAVVKPAKIHIDGAEAKTAAAIVEAGKMKVIAATFETVPLPVAEYNTDVVCPVIRMFDSEGQPALAVCKGWQSGHLSNPPPFLAEGILGAPTGTPPNRLLPVLSSNISGPVNGNCHTFHTSAGVK